MPDETIDPADFYAGINLHGNQLYEAVPEVVSETPTTSTVQGRIVSYQGSLYIAKTPVAGTTPTQYTYVELAQGGDLSGLTTRVTHLEDGTTPAGKATILATGRTIAVKGGATASGVSFDGSANIELDVTAVNASKINEGTVGIDYLPTGNENGKLVKLSGTIGSGEVIQYNGTGFVTKSLANILTYKGSKATKALLLAETASATAGDVWNCEEACTMDGQSYPAHTNFARNTYTYTSGNEEKCWDSLGGSIDTSAFEVKTNKKTDIESNKTSDEYYPSVKAVASYAAKKVTLSAMTEAALKTVKVNAEGIVEAYGDIADGTIALSKLAVLTASSALVTDASGVITASAVTATELGYLSGVTSAIQTQLNSKVATANIATAFGATPSDDKVVSEKLAKNSLDAKLDNSLRVSAFQATPDDTHIPSEKLVKDQLDTKQATITGAASTITADNLIVNKALVSNSDGKVAASAVSSTELGYVAGVTSAIQTQLDGKEVSSNKVTAFQATVDDTHYPSEKLVKNSLDAKQDKLAVAGSDGVPVYVSAEGTVSAVTKLDATKLDGIQPVATSAYILNSSTVSLTAGTALNVAHGCSGKPFVVTLTNSAGKVIYADISMDSANITIKSSASLSNVVIGWAGLRPTS